MRDDSQTTSRPVTKTDRRSHGFIQNEMHQLNSMSGVFPFSLIRTITVGSGISPDLLTSTNRALAGLSIVLLRT
jgi:hypothetical protein